ncbi:T9SS type A sorting domain-containing protein [Ignavibacterium album]|uniref:T9SS type A sorting domain-containing protein n=1 Tax=Ignavibacterium album TaxID=591197 RepID=UPI0026EA8467|nr:T9SS type A sorting domain-containing protein [Ignavibacterium album]
MMKLVTTAIKQTIFIVIILFAFSTNAQEVYTINSLADDEHAYAYDNPGTPTDESRDGICNDALGRCTLRAAIDEAHNRNTSAKFIFSVSGTINLINVIYLEDFCEIDGGNQIELSGTAAMVAQNNTKIRGLRVSAMFGVLLEGNNNIVGDFPYYNEFVNSQVGLTIGGDNNKVFNNYFGITQDGTLMPNQFGIIISGSNNEIGKADLANGNVICGNSVAGIEIATGSGNKVQHNLIGTTFDGRTDAGNGQGILIGGSDNNIIGGDNWDDGNVISGNTVYGIFISGAPPDSYSENNLIKNNNIGLNPDKTAAVPNARGITITNGTMSAEIFNNIISGNANEGINIFGYDDETYTNGHIIHGNSIGTDGAQGSFPNGGDGILIAGNVGIVKIGQDENGNYSGNTIVGNGSVGVDIVPLQGYSPERITVRKNTLHSNGLTNLFVDTSANNRIREPFNLQYNSGVITGKHALPNAIIDIYSANRFELPASAYFRIGTTNTDANGNFSFSTGLNIEAIAVTATDFWGNTSNFARLNIVTDVEDEKQIPTEFALEQNYPNPFNPSTKIRFSIPNVGTELALSVLKVYDILGNEVATLVNEEKPAGVYEVEFNASQLSSGIYFYKLSAGSFTEVKKMTVLK